MQWTHVIGAALGVVLVTGGKTSPPPVILDLGPVVPTPVPSPKAAEKKRLISTITVQNTAEGETVVSFEATDVADEGHGKIHTLASKRYSLAEEKPELTELRARVLAQVRDLERTLLEYAERAGPPKERAPLLPSEQVR